MEIKTINQILGDWDDYKNDHIDFNEDWTDEHDNYLNKEFISVVELVKELNTLVGGHLINHPENTIYALKSLVNALTSNYTNAKTNKDLEVSASPTPKESQKAIPSLNPNIK